MDEDYKHARYKGVDGYQRSRDGRVKIHPSRGPTLEFVGELIASTEWSARDRRMRLELYETAGGALIPVTIGTPHDEGEREIVSAEVVDRDDYLLRKGQEQAMRFAVMDFFDWHDRARSMVRELKWSLKRVVE